MALALVEVRSHHPRPPRLVRWVLALGREQGATLVMAAALFLVSTTPIAGSYDFNPTAPWESMFKHWLYLGAAALFLIPGIFGSGRGLASFMASPLPHRVGLVSYGIFLWHLTLIRLIAPALGIAYFTGRGWLLALVVVPLTLALATVTYVLVERPAQRWAHRR
jgi:peptidoglycan/LPS O-acetylase OafA/YrhL